MNPSQVYQIVTDRMLEALGRGVVPWHRPWDAARVGAQQNAVSRRAYRGMNVFLLAPGVQGPGFEDPRWLTFTQARELGGHVRRGERGRMVVFWKRLTVESETDDGEPTEKTIPLLRYYTVFNVEQCEGLRLAPLGDAPRELAPIEAAERIVREMPRRPDLRHGGERAFYAPAVDRVTMPPRASFDSAEAYYSTLFHELTHATGHQSRLDRHGLETGIAPFGSPVYSAEELVAEMGAAFLAAEAGLDEVTFDNSAAYVASWLRVLQDDPKLVVVAAGRAQRAADFILAREVSAT